MQLNLQMFRSRPCWSPLVTASQFIVTGVPSLLNFRRKFTLSLTKGTLVRSIIYSAIKNFRQLTIANCTCGGYRNRTDDP